MTTYNSYEEAKIANPDGVILENSGVFDVMDNIASSQINRWSKCNPADHCMTVEKFLANGHKFVEGKGDAYLDNKGVVRFISDNGYSAWGCNNVACITNSQESFILRAAALETKGPKRTKVEYVKWNFECAWHAIKAFEDGEKLYTKRSSEDFVLIDNAPDVLRYLYDLHERIETTIEWWEDAAEFMSELAELSITEDGDLRVMMLKDQIGFGMSRDKWCDFARILLEQGE